MRIIALLKSLFTSPPRVTPGEAAARVSTGTTLLIDVREPGEWAHGIARDAALLPLSDLTGRRTTWTAFLEEVRGRELLVYCAVGSRAALAAKILTAEGHRAAATGGLSDWARAGWPVVQPPR